jgi:hypothetical protein
LSGGQIEMRGNGLFNKLVIAASHSNIFDLIKVDYLVKDTNNIQNKLREEAARVIKDKVGRYEQLRVKCEIAHNK